MIINAKRARNTACDYKKREYKAMQNDVDILMNALMDNQEFVKYAVAILEKPINKNIELLSSAGMFQASYYPKFLSHKTDNGMMVLEGDAFDLFNKYVPMVMHKYKIKQSYATFINTDPDTKTKIVPRMTYHPSNRWVVSYIEILRTT